MQVLRRLSHPGQLTHTRTVLSIGSYDGIHRGHKQIIAQLKQAAAAKRASSSIITFYPRPRVVLSPAEGAGDYLTTVDEKLLIFEKLALDIVAVLPFSRQFAQTPARQFVRQVVNVFHPLEFWVGPDFKLGKDRRGDIPVLRALGQEFDFVVKVVDLKLAGGEVISSTRIRAELAAGHIKEVTRLLGNYPFLTGVVVPGAQRGRSIGFPTANIQVDKEKLLPANGVYAAWFRLDNAVYPAVANIGLRPTFNELEPAVEVHVFDFSQDIYGRTVRVELVERLRPEQKFERVDDLAAQIGSDARRARELLRLQDKDRGAV